MIQSYDISPQDTINSSFFFDKEGEKNHLRQPVERGRHVKVKKEQEEDMWRTPAFLIFCVKLCVADHQPAFSVMSSNISVISPRILPFCFCDMAAR